MRIVAILGFIALASITLADPPTISGEFESTLISGRNSGKSVTMHHVDRALFAFESGKATAQLAYFNYPYCEFQMLDESFLGYSDRGVRVRSGRLYETFGQSNWYDAWDSGFIFQSSIERVLLFGKAYLWQTRPAAEVQIQKGRSTLTLGAAEMTNRNDKFLLEKPDHMTARLETFSKGLVYGVGMWIHPDKLKSCDQAFSLDARYSKSHFNVRAQGIYAKAQSGLQQNGFNCELRYRPGGQTKLTLLARYHTIKMGTTGSFDRRANETLGTAYTFMDGFVAQANYNFGNQLFQQGWDRGWVFQLQKTVRF